MKFLTKNYYYYETQFYLFSNSSFSNYFSVMQTFVNFSNNETVTLNSLTFLNDILAKRDFLFLKLSESSNNSVSLLKSNLNIISDFKTLYNGSKTDIMQNSTKFNKNITLKSQYQTMRKGISNMIRIQADKAVAMPIETRLQILAVSKDIIHS